MTTEVVVASYGENLAWLSRLCHPHIVYNAHPLGAREHFIEWRGRDCFMRSRPVSYQPVPNVGREAGQFLFHIASRYDSLADFTIFVQADLGWSTGVASHIWVRNEGAIDLINKFVPPEDFTGILTVPDFARIEMIAEDKPQTLSEACPNMRWIWSHRRADSIIPKASHRTSGGQFCIHKDEIRKNPHSHYQRLLLWIGRQDLPKASAMWQPSAEVTADIRGCAWWLEFDWPVKVFWGPQEQKV